MLQVKVTVMMKAMGEYVMGVRDDGCYRDASLLKIVLSLMKRGRFILMKIYTRPSRKKALDHFAR